MTTASLASDLSTGSWETETHLVTRFLNQYARTLDTMDFATWPHYFTEAGVYSAITQENLGGAGMSLYVDRGREALNERAAYALGYWLAPQRKTLHVVSNVLVEGVEETALVTSAYLVLYRVNRRGESLFHVSAEYHDRVELTADGPRFASHQVVIDGSTMPADMSQIL
jgi:3-phenylpropionate/cinnamic acid dioxygenase small subunit